MATFNLTSSDNNANQVVWSWQTTIELRTDRATAAGAALHALVDSVQNLGTGVATGDPFTELG
jgi:hypothetical protein